LDGWEVCREIRRNSDVPILLLTAREDEMDRVLGFSLGADDYVVKPFSPRELVERVKAILRRARPRDPEPQILRQRGLTLEPVKHKVTVAGETVSLTPSEYKLLHCLMASPGRVYSRAELLARLYVKGEAVIDRVVDVHIGKLRQKIEADPSSPTYIRTVHGVGYCFAEDQAS
jgi:DNA-binding response OmpR family regulator